VTACAQFQFQCCTIVTKYRTTVLKDFFTMCCMLPGYPTRLLAYARSVYFVGGVYHCSLHCCLAKFRGLMYNAEYSPMIGWGNRTFCVVPVQIFRLWYFTSQSQGCILHCIRLYIKPRNFAKRQCKLQWLTPPNFACDLRHYFGFYQTRFPSYFRNMVDESPCLPPA
jgi:hypothetical protein